MKTHMLMGFSLVLVFAIPAISETCYKMHFQYLRFSGGEDAIKAECTLGKREPFVATENQGTTEKAIAEWAGKAAEDVQPLTNFTLEAGVEGHTVTVDEAKLVERSIGVEKAVFECTFGGLGWHSSITLRVLDVQANPRFGDVRVAWDEITWGLEQRKGERTWFVTGRKTYHSPKSRYYRKEEPMYLYAVVPWRQASSIYWPGEMSLKERMGEAIPPHMWMMAKGHKN